MWPGIIAVAKIYIWQIEQWNVKKIKGYNYSKRERNVSDTKIEESAGASWKCKVLQEKKTSIETFMVYTNFSVSDLKTAYIWDQFIFLTFQANNRIRSCSCSSLSQNQIILLEVGGQNLKSS